MSLRIIGGHFKNRPLKTPKGPQTRPSLAILRKAVFDILQDAVADADFLDLFAGSGAMGIEAISRGAARATFVDKDPHALQCLRENLKQFQIEDQATLLKTDAFRALKQIAQQGSLFDIIYIDPPYALSKHTALMEFIDTHDLLKDRGFVFIEEGPPATEYPPFVHLRWVSTRKFSQSLLHQFQYHKTPS